MSADGNDEVCEEAEAIPVEVELSTESEAEEFANRIMIRAASLTGVKIDRGTFLRSELKKCCPEADANLAVETTPIQADVSPADIDAMALAAIDFETKKCAALSFAAGAPGGVAMVGTVPADLAQYFAHVMRIEQKLAYLYGWQSFLNEDDEVDDETVARLVALMGVMMGVGSAANSITKFAMSTAQQGVAKAIERQALTKTFFYNPMKHVLRLLGVNLTKQTFAKTVSKVVPLIGGVVSGSITYASFKPSAETLRRYLRGLPLSGIDKELYPDIAAIRADLREKERGEALNQAKEAGTAALKRAGDTVAPIASVAGGAVQSAGRAMGDAFGALFGSLGVRGTKDGSSELSGKEL